MRSRSWFLLSILLFIAAAYFWRLGENRSAARRAAREQQTSVAPDKNSVARQDGGSNGSVSAKKPLPDLQTNSAASNPPSLYPYRLTNASKTIDQWVRSDQSIVLPNALIDTSAEGVNIPAHLRAKGDPGSYIVQARGVITELFRADLREANAEIVSYVPNNAYLVRMSAGDAKVLAANKGVRSILPWQPYYKLDTELIEMAVKNEVLPLDRFVRLTLFPGQRETVLEALKGNATVVNDDPKGSPFGPTLVVAFGDLVALANLAPVQAIEPYYDRVLMNDLTRVRLGVAADTLTGTTNYQGLTGANVYVNVNDTTIDNGHPDLAGRIFPLAGVGITDTEGHGTHVAGIIGSSGPPNEPDGGKVSGSVTNAGYRGKGEAIQILSMNIFGGFSDSEVQEIAARTNYVTLNRQSPLISNNSWVYGAGSYNAAAANYDMAVRDAIPGMTGSQPMIYVFAAGNSGRGNNSGEGGTPPVLSPATAKNVISVGALENFRNITNEIIRPNRSCVIGTNQEFLGLTDSSNQVASFSSRGNVGASIEGTYGRFKPDVVAPGTFIVSTRSRQFDEAAYYSTTNFSAQGFANVVVNAGATNSFLVFVPDDPCGQGRAIAFSIETQANANSPSPFPPLNIYVGAAPTPSTTPGNLAGANYVLINEGDAKFLRGLVYYDIVNTNSVEVSYDLRTVVTTTNDLGNYFTELKKLNDGLGTNYIFESGTSMAAPAISGMLALMQEFFEQKLPDDGRRRTNSPAMMKALLINSAHSEGPDYLKVRRSLNIQGWGLPNLTRTIPEILFSEPDTNKWPIQMFDQSTTEALATGDVHTRNVTVANTNVPLRITLVWTDPPGNPTVGVKLVNDLDLIVTAIGSNENGPVTNVYVGNNFPGGNEFTDAIEASTNLTADIELVRDVVNNVENVYINGPLATSYEVSVKARRVNVNAVTGHTNGIVQDYALVISSGDLTETAPIQVTPSVPPTPADPNAFVTVITNGVPLFDQRVGANSPLLATNVSVLSNGATNQWNFYVLNNPSNFQYIAFLTFLPPNLSGTTNVSPNSRRNVEADIDMYVSTEAGLTNLDATVIANSTKSRRRGGQELVVFTNGPASAVYYVGIKSEDQQAAEFSFFGVASQNPFSQDDGNGNLIVSGVPITGVEIPDGSPEKPGGVPYIAFATAPITVGRVIVTNTFTHERLGDLIGTLTHEQDFAVLHNHSFPETIAFPDGQESGTFTGIYDDSTLPDVVGSRKSEGPGSLLSFIGKEGVGAWIYTMEDNAVNATGRVDAISIFLERALETNQLNNGFGFSISPISIPAGQSRGLNFVVPQNATNMIISISPKEGAIDTVIRRGLAFPTRSPYVDKGKLIAPPGDTLTVDASDTPPLTPGRYTLRLFNDGSSAVTVRGFVRFEVSLSAASVQTYVSRGPTPAVDDAVTNSIIHVDRDSLVAGVEVGVHIDHPRVSDLVMHLVSPSGTRVLLAENRGGITTNGYGYSSFTTNSSSASDGDASASTNVIPAALNQGIVNIDYEFFLVPDSMHVYYDGLLIFDSGLVSNSGKFSVPFGPGVDTSVVIVINEGGNIDLSTRWQYTAEIVSGALIYATFSENTNLALVPIKFAIPPFATNPPGSRLTFDSSGFENDLPGNYSANVDNWTVTTNTVDVIGDLTRAHRGTNFLSLGTGGISRTLPTTQGKLYNLSFAYRSETNNLAMAKVSLDGVFTNDFIGVPAWIVHSTTFAAPTSGTKFDITGLDPGVLIDSLELTEGGDPNYFLPEESLTTLIGENAKGDWKLEIWDSRAGASLGGQVLSWQLQLTFASTNAVATTITNGLTITNIVSGAEIIYFIIDVPISATRATNVLVSGGGPLNLLFNDSQLPIGNSALGDLTLLSSTVNGTNILATDSFPYLEPGGRYYLGVKNVSAAQTNVFTLTVTFDETNNLFNVTPLQNMVPYGPTNLPISRTIQYYQYDLSNAISSIEFKLFNLSNDVDLVVRRGALPDQNNYDYTSNLGGTNDEVVTVNFPAAGRYYLGVYGFLPTNDITYSVLVTEGAAIPPTFVGAGTLDGTGFHIDANTIIGRNYDFQFSTDLIFWSSVPPGSPITAIGAITTFTDSTASTAQTARFYRLILLP